MSHIVTAFSWKELFLLVAPLEDIRDALESYFHFRFTNNLLDIIMILSYMGSDTCLVFILVFY